MISDVQNITKTCEIKANTHSVSLFKAFRRIQPFICNHHQKAIRGEKHAVKDWNECVNFSR